MSARPLAPSVDRARPRRALAYRLCSLSSASLDRYPENRPTRFTHHLPSRFFLDPGKQYVVSLLSLSLTSERLENWSEPSYVRVHLAQLEQNAFDSPGRVRCLAQLVLPDRTRDPASATALDWFDLCSPIPVLLDPTLPSLDTLAFEITDEKNDELKLGAGRPTILDLLIEEMDVADRFSLTVSPSLSKHRFGDNTDADFVVSFGSPVAVGADWEVALHSVIVPSGIHVVGEFFQLTVELASGGARAFRYKNTGQRAGDVLRLLQAELVQLGIFVLRRNDEQYEVQFEAAATRTPEMGRSLRMSPGLCKLFNLQHYDPKEGFSFFAPREEEGAGGGGGGGRSASQEVFPYGATFHPDATVAVNEQIVLYSDLVQSSVFGDHRAPLVDILSTVKLGLLENEGRGDTLYTVPNLTFRPAARANITEFSLKINDVHGNGAEFEYARDGIEMQYVFVFRK